MNPEDKLDCGHDAFPAVGAITGAWFAIRDGKKICYDCAAEPDKAAIERRDPTVFAYVRGDGREITTWAGRWLMSVLQRRECTNRLTGQPTWYYRCIDEYGQEWYGRGAGHGMVIKLHPRKK